MSRRSCSDILPGTRSWRGMKASRSGLGLEFQSAVDATLGLVTQHPALFRRVRGQVRRAVVKRFPYTIHFLDEQERIVVLAVYHVARDPRKLGERG